MASYNSCCLHLNVLIDSKIRGLKIKTFILFTHRYGLFGHQLPVNRGGAAKFPFKST